MSESVGIEFRAALQHTKAWDQDIKLGEQFFPRYRKKRKKRILLGYQNLD